MIVRSYKLWVVLIVLALLQKSLQAQQPLLKLEGSLNLNQPSKILAISPDDTMIALAIENEADTTVAIIDRRVLKPLGLINSTVGAIHELKFSLADDVLAILGNKGLELWHILIDPLNPNQPLDEGYRISRHAWPEDEPINMLAFLPLTKEVSWNTPQGYYKAPYTTEFLVTMQDMPPLRSINSGIKYLGWQALANKTIHVTDLDSRQTIAELEGHRFPVNAIGFNLNDKLISLDDGYQMLVWTNTEQHSVVIDPVPRDWQPLSIMALGLEYALVTVHKQNDYRALVVSTASGKIDSYFEAAGSAAAKASYSGQYVAILNDERLTLYSFAKPIEPREYVSLLADLDAQPIAMQYLRWLNGISLGERQRLEDIINNPNLSNFAQNSAGELQEPNAGLANGQLAQHQRILEQAQRLFDAGDYAGTISILSNALSDASDANSERPNLQSADANFAQYRSLLRRAEQQRGMDLTAEQAQEMLYNNRIQAAEALINEVLRQNSEHAQALRLKTEIERRKSLAEWDNWWWPMTIPLVAGALAGLFLLQRRKTKPKPPKTDAKKDAGPKVSPASNQTAKAKPVKPVSAEQLDELKSLLGRVEILHKKLTVVARNDSEVELMEIQAELNNFRRRLSDGISDFEGAKKRLRELAMLLKGLLKEYEQQEPKAEKNTKTKTGAKTEATAKSSSVPNYYNILGVKHDANSDEIKSAYVRLLKQYHPDIHNSSDYGWVKQKAEEMSKLLGEAYQVLSDKERRRLYNEELKRSQNRS